MYVLKLGSICNHVHTITCDSCNSELIYNGHDIYNSYDMNGNVEFRYIRCPVCGKYIEVE